MFIRDHIMNESVIVFPKTAEVVENGKDGAKLFGLDGSGKRESTICFTRAELILMAKAANLTPGELA